MRRVAAHLEMSLDGMVDAPERWAHGYFAEEMLQAAQAGMRDTDAVLFGRRTYEEFAAHWPTVDSGTGPFAGFLNRSRKLVASSTLTTLQWGPAELVSGDVVQGVADLKRKPGAMSSSSAARRLSARCFGQASSTSSSSSSSRS